MTSTSSQSNVFAAPWTRKRLDANHSMIHDAAGMTVVPRMITEPGAASEAKGDLVTAAPALHAALEAIARLVQQAVNQKVRTGRLPPLGKLLSEIEDTARAAIDEVRP